jgi:hypothetical protein
MPSTLAEIARQEAEEAETQEPDVPLAPDEAEQGEQEEADEQEHEQAPDVPEPPPTPEQIEARVKSWERERDRHFRELQKRDEYRYGQSQVCVLCDGHGLFLPTLGEPEDTFRRQQITQALGGQVEPELLDDPDTEACERCGANGMLLTHSKVTGQEKRVCTACNGQGWKPKPVAVTAPAVFTATNTANGGALVPPSQQGAADAWGRPQGHPHYGILPSAVGA